MKPHFTNYPNFVVSEQVTVSKVIEVKGIGECFVYLDVANHVFILYEVHWLNYGEKNIFTSSFLI